MEQLTFFSPVCADLMRMDQPDMTLTPEQERVLFIQTLWRGEPLE